ncbi:MAG: copper resistance protein B [Pseudomonadota bacterium]
MRCRLLILASLACMRCGFAQGQSELEHVPPDVPQSRVHSMPYGEMAGMMGMDDRKRFGKVMLDEVEWQDSDAGSTFEWNAAAWYGGDYHKLRIESEGTRTAGETHEARTELLWERIVTPWWSVRAGARHDAGSGPARDWASIGLAGLAPGFIEVEAAAYFGEGGRGALRLTSHYDLLLTQRLILQPQAELNAYTRDDVARLIGSGLSDLTLGLRLRYEWQREFAPYLGVIWAAHFGDSADLRQAAGETAREATLIAGIRAWF